MKYNYYYFISCLTLHRTNESWTKARDFIQKYIYNYHTDVLSCSCVSRRANIIWALFSSSSSKVNTKSRPDKSNLCHVRVVSRTSQLRKSAKERDYFVVQHTCALEPSRSLPFPPFIAKRMHTHRLTNVIAGGTHARARSIASSKYREMLRLISKLWYTSCSSIRPHTILARGIGQWLSN